MFVTVFYAIYDVKTGELNYCNAGHNSPFVLHADGTVEMLPTSTNCMIGAINGLDFNEQTMQLGKGDILLTYTDGVNEAVNTAFEEYGDDRMENALSEMTGKSCKEVIDGLLASVKAFAGEAPQSDDITLMALKRW
jgi:sigma-B regulation protein RsbU (phosphoserine phosphatase)